MSRCPEHIWNLIEARRELLDVLPKCDERMARDVQARIGDLELIELAMALKLPAAISGHAELLTRPQEQARPHEPKKAARL